MDAKFYHLQLNVSSEKSIIFYKKLFSFLKYKVKDESNEHLGVSDGNSDFWIIKTEEKHIDKKFHRKAIGINHIAFRASSPKDIDHFTKNFLKKEKIKILYGSPKKFPEYSKDYYAVFFEDPDRIKLELCYVK